MIEGDTDMVSVEVARHIVSNSGGLATSCNVANESKRVTVGNLAVEELSDECSLQSDMLLLSWVGETWKVEIVGHDLYCWLEMGRHCCGFVRSVTGVLSKAAAV